MPSNVPEQQAPEILLFARGVMALFDLWPALTIAVKEEWGGPDSADKKLYLLSAVIDAFEQGASYTTPDAAGVVHVDPKSAADPPLDEDQVADMLDQYMSDEYEAVLEDGSSDMIAKDVSRLWRDCVAPGERSAEDTVGALERKAAEISKKPVHATKHDENESDDEEGDWSDEDDDDKDEVPQLVESKPKEKQEPIIDDDGFELVQKKGRR